MALKRASAIAVMWIVFLTCWFLLCSSSLQGLHITWLCLIFQQIERDNLVVLYCNFPYLCMAIFVMSIDKILKPNEFDHNDFERQG